MPQRGDTGSLVRDSVLWALTLIFLILKLTGVISWSWWWVFSPLWLPIAVALAFFAVIGVMALLGVIVVVFFVLIGTIT